MTKQNVAKQIGTTFQLNIDRAIARKLETTKRSANVSYKFTGGGITGNADAISFEQMKNALFPYFTQIKLMMKTITYPYKL